MPDHVDNDLAKARQSNDIANLERRAGFSLEDAFASTDAVDEQPMLGHTGLRGRDG